jgi:hypothetical protein
MIITIFQNFNAVSAPFHRPIEDILDRIKTGKSKALIEQINSEKDIAKQKELQRKKKEMQ